MQITSDHIRKYIEKHEISLNAFARFTNETVPTIKKWLSGEPLPEEAQTRLREKLNLNSEGETAQ